MPAKHSLELVAHIYSSSEPATLVVFFVSGTTHTQRGSFDELGLTSVALFGTVARTVEAEWPTESFGSGSGYGYGDGY